MTEPAFHPKMGKLSYEPQKVLCLTCAQHFPKLQYYNTFTKETNYLCKVQKYYVLGHYVCKGYKEEKDDKD